MREDRKYEIMYFFQKKREDWSINTTNCKNSNQLGIIINQRKTDPLTKIYNILFSFKEETKGEVLQYLEKGGLAAAVGPKKHPELPRVDAERAIL